MNNIDVNQVLLIGEVSDAPEFRRTQSGSGLCKFRVLTTERYTGRDGQLVERKNWNRVTVWGRKGEDLSQSLHQGQRVYVLGRLQTRSYDDKDGNKRWATEVVAQTCFVLESGQGTQYGPPAHGGNTGYGSTPQYGPAQQPAQPAHAAPVPGHYSGGGPQPAAASPEQSGGQSQSPEAMPQSEPSAPSMPPSPAVEPQQSPAPAEDESYGDDLPF